MESKGYKVFVQEIKFQDSAYSLLEGVRWFHSSEEVE